MLRAIAIVAGLAFAFPAIGGEMTASDARHFVTGKLFRYACFDGTRGLARVNPDGSIDGSIQPKGTGPTRYGTLPAATLRVEGLSRCRASRPLTHYHGKSPSSPEVPSDNHSASASATKDARIAGALSSGRRRGRSLPLHGLEVPRAPLWRPPAPSLALLPRRSTCLGRRSDRSCRGGSRFFLS